jgi:GxxExxY protein
MLEENRIAREVVDVAVKLHKRFGPGVYETVYEPVLIHELKKRALSLAIRYQFRSYTMESLSTLHSRWT